jgi:hypothetical protein
VKRTLGVSTTEIIGRIMSLSKEHLLGDPSKWCDIKSAIAFVSLLSFGKDILYRIILGKGYTDQSICYERSTVSFNDKKPVQVL